MCINEGIIHQIFRKKVKGGALYIAIIVSIIIGILLTMFILLAKYNNRNIIVFSQASQLQYNLKSAFEIAKSDYFGEEKNNTWFKNSFNDDSIKIKRFNWGAYLLIAVETKNRHHKLAKAGLYGTAMSSDTGLVTSDKGRPIGVSGAIVFKANCYLPKAGIKPAFIEGQSYLGSGQNNGFIKPAPIQVSEINESFKKGISIQQDWTGLFSDSLVTSVPNTVKHSFNKKTIAWEVNSAKLSGLRLNGNIKIISSGNLEIDSTCHFENILIICDKIIFKEGFKGSVHVIANDSIIVNKKCEFSYPSSFVLSIKKEKNALHCIQLNEDCVFFGGIIAFKNSKNPGSAKAFVKLNATSEVNGFIYSEDYLHAEGKMNANVFCNTMLLKTPSAVYENHLLGCEIDPRKYSSLLAIPIVINKTNRFMNCCNLN